MLAFFAIFPAPSLLIPISSTNVIGVIYTTNAFLPPLKTGSTRKVITMSTPMASTKMVVKAKSGLLAPDAISKAAVNMVNGKYAAELGTEGFIFLPLSPGHVTSPHPSAFGMLLSCSQSTSSIYVFFNPP